MNPFDAARWQMTTTLIQINALTNWAKANHAELSLPTMLFLAFTIRKLHLYILTVHDILSTPTIYRVHPRLIF